MREPRLGDDIDDFCVRCKRIMNHAIVSVINAEPAKVRCRTCHSDHDYRHEQAPPPKVDLRKQALFNDVLKKVDPTEAAAGDAEEVMAEEPAPADDSVEAPVEEAVVAEAAGDPPAATKRAKAKGKSKK